MAVPQRINNKERINKWWQSVQFQYRGVLRLAQANKSEMQRIPNLANTLYQVKQAYDVFEQNTYPLEATEIHRHMLAIMTNLIACLQHASHGNGHERDVLFEIMQVDTHMLDISLMENDMPPLN